ncbi:MAG: hypothetical protein KIT69_06345 [Propionibacteriaceae bacterium]|nr:hypothetical protein [Propionibacteriaceae bacterium]
MVEDDAIGYLRETPGELVLVMLAWVCGRASGCPRWLLPPGAAPRLLYGGRLSATPDLTVGDDALVVSGEGPAVGIWRLG